MGFRGVISGIGRLRVGRVGIYSVLIGLMVGFLLTHFELVSSLQGFPMLVKRVRLILVLGNDFPFRSASCTAQSHCQWRLIDRCGWCITSEILLARFRQGLVVGGELVRLLLLGTNRR